MRFEWRGVVESRLYYFSGRRAWREKTRKARREILESRVFCLLVVFFRVRFKFFLVSSFFLCCSCWKDFGFGESNVRE